MIYNELQATGQSIYESLTEGRDATAAHKAMALNAARIADTLDAIQLELAINPQLIVINSQGTRTANPLITEARQLTAALSQILAKLGVAALPDTKPTEKTKRDELAEKRANRRRATVRGSDPEDSIQPASAD